MSEWVDMMPSVRAAAREHPDFRVMKDGTVTLAEGVMSSELVIDE